MVKKTKIRATSISAFVDILEDLGFKEMQVFQTIKKIQPCSDKMIANHLGWKINCVTGRRNSLAHYHMIIIYKKDLDKIEPFKKVIYWKIPEWMNGVLTN
jgi:hypothetical protein